MKRLFLLLLLLCAFRFASAQIIAGPMPGPVELREAVIWVQVRGGTVLLDYAAQSAPGTRTYTVIRPYDSVPAEGIYRFRLRNLEPGTTYRYALVVDRKRTEGGTFTTKDLWQWRKPAPDFSFLAGSCAYFNEPVYDRPGRPYGQDSSIFEAMAKEPASFMLWLGDNWYYREVDFFSAGGLWYRARRDRSQPVLQRFLKAMPHLAIWDDHDYGPNDADKSYVLKEEARRVFQHYWNNPSAGEKGEGIYTKYSHGDVDFFLMDDRWFRSANHTPARINGAPNPAKRMWGAQQLEWLKNALRSSNATFKLIASGNQVLNEKALKECMQDYPAEFQELMQFLNDEKIAGVVFLTGDRHHSEVIRYERPGAYPLFEVTSSPLTAGTSRVTGTAEADNPQRVAGTLVEGQNYSRFTVRGPREARRLEVQYLGRDGKLLGQWSVSASELKHPQ